MSRGDKILYGIALLGLLAASIFPFTSPSGFWLRTLTFVFMAAILAQGWNFIGGYTGYVSFGNMAFFGLGAYVTGILMAKAHVDFAPSMLAGGVFCAGFAIIVGLPLLRLKGHYFAVATLGVSVAVREIIAGWDSLTGGGIGLNLPINPDRNSFQQIYFWMLAVLTISILVTFLLARHRAGYAWLAIRENEYAARALGIDTTMYKTLAFALTGLFTGLAGGVYAYYNTTISPDAIFDIAAYTANPILITILGGSGTVLGPLFGALIFQILSTYLSFQFPGLQFTFLGLAMILVIIFIPGGVLEYLTGRRVMSVASLLQAPRENRA
ncbi:MAG TPA: branched-chain amino acid ABC transporter permease [Anaerolineae bacterium]